MFTKLQYFYKKGLSKKSRIFSYISLQFLAATLLMSPFLSTAQTCPPSGGGLLREVWNNIPGTSVSSIPVNTRPSSISYITSGEGAPVDIGDNYGTRIRGYVTAPGTAPYRFIISGDDNCELWLGTSEDPSTKRKIASVDGWTNRFELSKYPSQESDAIDLIGGQKYYIEILHKEAGGGDHVEVGWTSMALMKSGETSFGINQRYLTPIIRPDFPCGECSPQKGLLREFWANVPGYSVSSIPVSTSPTSVSYINSSDAAPVDVADNYGARIRGYVTPPSTGEYRFYISGDDNCELWLGTSEDPSTKTKIASVTGWTNRFELGKYPEQISGPITLFNGKKYYIEILHKEGGGGDHVEVSWSSAEMRGTFPISGTFLTPVSLNPAPEAVAAPDQSRCGSGTVKLSVPNPVEGLTYKWYESATGPLLFEGSQYEVSVSSSRSFWVSATSPSGCEGVRTEVKVEVFKNPDFPEVDNVLHCGPGRITLSIKNPEPGIQYYWSAEKSSFSVLGTQYTYDFTSSDRLMIGASDSRCLTVNGDIRVNIVEIPQVPVVQDVNRASPGTVTLTVENAEEGVDYYWYSNKYSRSVLGTSYTYFFTESDQLSVTATRMGCLAVNQNVNVTIGSSSSRFGSDGASDVNSVEEIKAFPNPFAQETVVTLPGKKGQFYQYSLIDARGVEMEKGELEAATGNLVGSDLHSGLYSLIIRNSGESKVIIKK